MQSKSLKVPSDVYAKITEMKIRVATEVGHIPTTGEILRIAISLSDSHYGEFLAQLSRSESETGDET